MEIYINIDGVLRNTIQKFDYHYKEFYLNSIEDITTSVSINDNGEEEVITYDLFEYGVDNEVRNDNLQKYYCFQSVEEYNNFTYIEFPIEIFGHAGVSYPTVMSDLNKLIYENTGHTFTLVGIDNIGKAKPSTLFFLSKNGCLAHNIKFITEEKIDNLWNNCDIWITDDKKVIDACPKDKVVVKFNTIYNNYFTHPNEINKLNKIEKTWQITMEKVIT